MSGNGKLERESNSGIPPSFFNGHELLGLRNGLVQFDPTLRDEPVYWDTIWGYFVEQNWISKILQDPRVCNLNKQNNEHMGQVIGGAIACFDGRNAPILQLGRDFSYHLEPGALIEFEKGSNHLMPRSTYLAEGLRAAANNPDAHLLQLMIGHFTKLTDQPCGKMLSMQAAGQLEGLSLEAANLKFMTRTTDQAVTAFYNHCRRTAHLPELPSVCVPVMFDTDRRGIVLNFGQTNELSTNDFTEEIRQQIESLIGEQAGHYASFRDNFDQVSNLVDLMEKRSLVTTALLREERFTGLRDYLDIYLQTYHSDLTDYQRKGLGYVIATTMAFQYLTGLSEKSYMPNHQFMRHGERFLVASPGKTPFTFFPDMQTFAGTPADSRKAVEFVKTQIGIMRSGHGSMHGNTEEPITMFLSTPISADNFQARDDAYIMALAMNGELFRSIMQDPELRKLIDGRSLRVYPLMSSAGDRSILEVPNQSVYIF